MVNVSDVTFDYIVVGGGSAGSVIAGRLSEDTSRTVLLVEAGRNDTNPLLHIPAGIGALKSENYEYNMKSVPLQHCANQQIDMRQAKVIGGGGSINAQVFTRGAPVDWEIWSRDYGCEGWEPENVARVFRKWERNERFSAPYHGTEGPVGVSDQANPHPLSMAFVRAGQELGLPYNPDFNGASQYGVGLYQRTTWNGLRSSTSAAYLKGRRRRKNLTCLYQTPTLKVNVEGGRAVGVDIVLDGSRVSVKAAKEVILTAGAYFSPHLLQLSGIGDPTWLREAGIDLVHELPGVGKNLQDHPRVDLAYGIRNRVTMDRYQEPWWGGLAGIEYLSFRKGPLTSTLAEAGCFDYAEKDAVSPDQQVHFVPAMTHEFAKLTGYGVGHGVGIDAYALRPTSRGTVTTISADPRQLPLLDPNFLATEYDVDQMVYGVKLMRELMRQPSMAMHVKGEYLFEYDDLVTKDQYVDFVRKHIVSACHPTGTCSMGTREDSVVSPTLKVHGLEGLRVADASVMPTVPSSNTQAPTIMVAEMAVEFITGGN